MLATSACTETQLASSPNVKSANFISSSNSTVPRALDAYRHGIRHLCRERPRPKLLHRVQPIVDVLARPVLCQAVTFVNFAFELIALAIDLGKIVVGELAPLLLDLSFSLLPISFHAVPIHRYSPALLALHRKHSDLAG